MIDLAAAYRDAEVVREARAMLARQWSADPRLVAYLRGDPPPTDIGAYARIRQMAVALQLVATEDWRLEAEPPEGYSPLAVLTQLAGMVRNANLVPWSRGRLADAWSAAIPRHRLRIRPDESPTCHVFERPWHSRTEGGAGVGSSDLWFTNRFEAEPKGLTLHVIGLADASVAGFVSLAQMVDGSMYPDDTPGVLANLVALRSFQSRGRRP